MGDIFNCSDSIPRKVDATNKNYYTKNPTAHRNKHLSFLSLGLITVYQ
jgi:hypothetical protein